MKNKLFIGEEIRVLDHGYLRLIDYMGSEESIIEAARMSTSGSFVSWEPYDKHPKGDAGLLEYLYKHRHLSPFEMCEIVFEVQLPIFVAREWMRHRTFSFNEFSGRYSKMLDMHYIPTKERLLLANTNPDVCLDVIYDFRSEQHTVHEGYEVRLVDNMDRELARINTPLSCYTRMRVKANLRNWLQFLELRLPKNAQWEIRQYAEGVASFIKDIYPRTYLLFEEWTLGAVTVPKSKSINSFIKDGKIM